MASYIALLRAINVGGTGKLPMSELRALCEQAGFSDVRNYIQSGNIVFRSGKNAATVTAQLRKALASRMPGSPGVLLRTNTQMAAVLRRNPFPDASPSRVLVHFLEAAANKQQVDAIEAPGREEIRASGHEVFVHYPDGIGRSKLKLPFAAASTARNINTVAKLIEMAAEL